MIQKLTAYCWRLWRNWWYLSAHRLGIKSFLLCICAPNTHNGIVDHRLWLSNRLFCWVRVCYTCIYMEHHKAIFHKRMQNSIGLYRPISNMEISLIFPSKCQSVIKGHAKGPSCEKISQWCFNGHSLVNWKVYRFREISLSFQPRIFGKL